jgi:cytosine/adenosine deaminase-related metal-dependent hydrolase
MLDDDGRIEGFTNEAPDAKVQNLKGGLTPGFINAHCHLELSHLKHQIPTGKGLVDFLIDITTNRFHADPAYIQQAICDAEQEMIDAGIVAVGDICNTLDTLPAKQAGRMQYHSFIECIGLLPSHAQQRFKHCEHLYQSFPEGERSICLHAPYSVSKELINLVDSRSAGAITSIHNQESEAENQLFLDGNGDFLRLFRHVLNSDDMPFISAGKRSLQAYLSDFIFQKKLILVHNTCSNEEDIRFALSMDKQLSWCLCPNANLYIENTLPPVHLLRSMGCMIVLGTDSLASNNQLSILAEMATLKRYFPDLPMDELFGWATLNGAKALGKQMSLGSFEHGKKPGVLHLPDLKTPDAIKSDTLVYRIADAIKPS